MNGAREADRLPIPMLREGIIVYERRMKPNSSCSGGEALSWLNYADEDHRSRAIDLLIPLF